MNKVETYIEANDLEGTKTADVLRDYEKARNNLGHICFFYDYGIDRAVSHIWAIFGKKGF